MSPFEFVAVFFSVIIGLGISHLLRAISDLVEIRDRVRTDWVHAVYVVLVFIWLVHSWWGMWTLQEAPSWSYGAFLLMVGTLASVYMMSALALPRAPEQGVVDLRAHFDVVRPVFLGAMALSAALAVPVNHLLFGTPLISYFVLAPAFVVVAALVGIKTAARRYHAVMAVVLLVLFVTFMALDTTVLK